MRPLFPAQSPGDSLQRRGGLRALWKARASSRTPERTAGSGLPALPRLSELDGAGVRSLLHFKGAWESGSKLPHCRTDGGQWTGRPTSTFGSGWGRGLEFVANQRRVGKREQAPALQNGRRAGDCPPYLDFRNWMGPGFGVCCKSGERWKAGASSRTPEWTAGSGLPALPSRAWTAARGREGMQPRLDGVSPYRGREGEINEGDREGVWGYAWWKLAQKRIWLC